MGLGRGQRLLPAFAQDGDIGFDGDAGEAQFPIARHVRGVADEDAGLFPRFLRRGDDDPETLREVGTNTGYGACPMIRRGVWVIQFSLWLGIAGTVVAQDGTERFQEVVQRLVQAIQAQDFAVIQQDFSQKMLDALPVEKSKQFFTTVLDQFGKIEKHVISGVRDNTPGSMNPDCALGNAVILMHRVMSKTVGA